MSPHLVLTRRTVAAGLAFSGLASPARAQDPAGYTPRLLSAAEAQEDTALMRRALETVHPGYYRRTTPEALNAAFATLEEAASAPISELDFYRRISLLLAQIRCSHTKAEQPPGFETWRTANPSHLPFRFRLIERRMIVVSATAETGLRRGAEILEINGRSIRRLTRELGEYVSIDGETTWCRPEYLAHDGDLMGCDFDHFYPYVYGPTDQFALTVRDVPGERPRRLDAPAISFTDWLALENDGRPYRGNFSETTRWRMADAETGYLQVETFVNYRRPTDAQALFTRAITELREAGAQRLIVDLRTNGGGSDDAALALIDHLALRPYTFLRAIRLKAVRYGDLADYIETWGDRDALFNPPMEQFVQGADGWFDRRPVDYPTVLQERAPAAAAFQGPVTLLIGPANASGATMVVSKLKNEGRVRLVGERCGGSGDGPTAGQIFNVGLPNSGIKVRVPLQFNQMNVAHFDSEGGVTPEVRVRPRVVDFHEGRDRALEVALAP